LRGPSAGAPSKYLNRLSDLLFTAGRWANDGGRRDVLWAPGATRQRDM
jgi:cob(I)alamin adenosyltransferase